MTGCESSSDVQRFHWWTRVWGTDSLAASSGSLCGWREWRRFTKEAAQSCNRSAQRMETHRTEAETRRRTEETETAGDWRRSLSEALGEAESIRWRSTGNHLVRSLIRELTNGISISTNRMTISVYLYHSIPLYLFNCI